MDIDALQYMAVGGKQWRMLPSEFPPLAERLYLLSVMEKERYLATYSCSPSSPLYAPPHSVFCDLHENPVAYSYTADGDMP